MKRLRVVLGLLLVGAAVCAGLVGGLLAVLRPERAAPELGTRPREARVVRSVAPSEDGCELTVVVRGPDGPLPDAEVRLANEKGPYSVPWAATPTLDPDGRATVPVPCDQGALARVFAPGHAPAHEWIPAWEGREHTFEVVLVFGLLLHGRVADPDGHPIPDATITSGIGETTTDADGAYELWADPGRNAVSASAFGYDSDVRSFGDSEEPPGPEGLQIDFVLVPRRELRVWCAGLPGDACGDIPMQCTTPYMLVGDRCHFDDETGETRCTCPEGSADVAVRGGGRAVLVDGDAEEAWLDFRDAGTIVGRVSSRGRAPDWCLVTGVRVPDALEDLPRGLVAGRRGDCDADGSFRLDGLVPGDWELALQARSLDDPTRHERILVPRAVRPHAIVDVGTVELPGGGTIEGVVIDGVTGSPLNRAPVIAVRRGEHGERVTLMGGDTDDDGSFRMEGLPAGSWTLAHVLSPQERVPVTVRDGETRSGVEIVTSDATALDENGFALQDEDGALVVSDVAPGGPADEAGLEPGEQVVGVLVGGFDIAGAVGEDGAPFARAVLGHWDGPGVTLVVRNPDGSEEEVPLDW